MPPPQAIKNLRATAPLQEVPSSLKEAKLSKKRRWLTCFRMQRLMMKESKVRKRLPEASFPERIDHQFVCEVDSFKQIIFNIL